MSASHIDRCQISTIKLRWNCDIYDISCHEGAGKGKTDVGLNIATNLIVGEIKGGILN